ncbi:unnamed protein product [Ectocarpus sp. 6 AP-2014]
MSDDTINSHAATAHMAAGGARWGGGGDATRMYLMPPRSGTKEDEKKKESRGFALTTETLATKKKGEECRLQRFPPGQHPFPSLSPQHKTIAAHRETRKQTNISSLDGRAGHA